MLDNTNIKEIRIPCLEVKSYWINKEGLEILLKNGKFKYYENISKKLYKEIYENLSDGTMVVSSGYYGLIIENKTQFKEAFIYNNSIELSFNSSNTFISHIKDSKLLDLILSKYIYQKYYHPKYNHHISTFEDGRILETTEYANKIISATLYNNLKDYNNYIDYIHYLENLANRML